MHIVAFKTSTNTLYRDRKESKKALWGPKYHDFGGNALEIVFDDMASKIVHMGLQKGMVVPNLYQNSDRMYIRFTHVSVLVILYDTKVT